MRIVLTGGTEPAREAIAAAAGGEGEIAEFDGNLLREVIRLSDASSVELRIVDDGAEASSVEVDNVGGEAQRDPDRPVDDEGVPEQEPVLEGDEAKAAGENAVGEPSASVEEELAPVDPNAPRSEDGSPNPASDPEKDYEASSEAEELAEAEAVDLNEVEGHGADGRILVSDVRAAIEKREADAAKERAEQA
jgi:pyruvate/2-oxoglutarate dehydrogenase complex dihydrolipoamide acyltransferase (E2) component